jgi:hypothetical protein
LINAKLILNLVEDTDKILYTFEKDGKFAMSSSIRNELFQEANASLKQVKEALAQPPKPRNFCLRCGKRTPNTTDIHTCTPPRGLEMT